MAKKTKNIQYYEAVGRHKEAVARVRFYLVGKTNEVTVGNQKIKKGEIMVNKKPITSVFPAAVERHRYGYPLALTDSEDRFAVSIHVSGGGRVGQLGAIVHGLARALERVDASYRATLKKEKLLTRDPRTRERRKVGTGGKARRAKQSPKR
ncbi:30S ribosomal protein S9 [Patescibacteria group bacterium]|nr:30S ribosomal protein S9 [Patescibacteria group bacterium]MCL5091700.1 30S ribosomal protein S9 [Patescibacteria group bacterium]